MNTKRVKQAAASRGMYFNGKKQWVNNVIGRGYFIYPPYGPTLQSDTLNGLYQLVMKYPRIESY